MGMLGVVDRATALAGRPTVGFLFAGGAHQMLHIAPAAAALAGRGDIDVRAFVPGDADADALKSVLTGLGVPLAVERLPAPSWARAFGWMQAGWHDLKLPRLVAARRRFATLDVLVTAERTSTILTRFPGPRPVLVHIPHGAGDRARGFERRIARFDHVIVSGDKDRDRMIAEGLVAADGCSVSGSIKLSALRRAPRRSLFDDARPVVLYNPHFDAKLSSWARFGPALIAAFAAQDRFNLIVAPHIRMFAAASSEVRRRFEALAVTGRIIVDAGSARSCDMTYTRAADVYVGDVSSQVYEFIDRPRPCVFLNRDVGAWRDDPSFAFWHFGDVVTDPADVLDAVEQATSRHSLFATLQRTAATAALGDAMIDGADRAASIIARLAADAQSMKASRSRLSRSFAVA